MTRVPLSVGQESLWLLHTLAPDSAAYNQATAVLMAPGPDLRVLSRAVRALVERHDLLRSRFLEEGGQPYREICPPDLVVVEVRDVAEAADDELRVLAERIGDAPLRLSQTGPLRVVLLRRSEDAVLVVATHHIATDALSQRLLWRDLMTAYVACRDGVEPDWAPLTASYQDYLRRERDLLDTPSRRDPLAAYWGQVVAGAVAAVLPTDRPRPVRSAFTGDTVREDLPADLMERVAATARALRVTPFAVLVGAFQAVLHRYTGQPDLTIGCPTAIRRGHKLRDVVGLLVNTMPLRARFGPATTVAEVIVDAGRQVSEGVPRVGYPYPLMLAARPGRDPLFRIAITLVRPRHDDELPEADGRVTRYAGHRVLVLDLPQLEGQTDLTVEITQNAAGDTAVSFRYDTELFERSTVERLVRHLVRVTGLACADPAQRVSRVSMVDDAERSRLIALGSA